MLGDVACLSVSKRVMWGLHALGPTATNCSSQHLLCAFIPSSSDLLL
jgi:hypothetical protein